MKTLKELCKDKIISRYSFFKESLDILPNELKEEVKNGEFNSNYQIIDGKVYPRKSQPCVISNDWLTYKL